MNRFSKLLFAAAASVAVCTSASAALVGIYAGGGFGGTAGGANTAAGGPSTAFVNSGFLVQAGQQIQVTATGMVCLSGNSSCAGADGQVLSQFGNGTAHYTAISNVFGALLGAIVADDSGSFQAFDATDVGNGIALSWVFKLGSNMTFTAASSGRVYLGVSDSAFWDNGGTGFNVTLALVPGNAVPEPTPLALLAIAGLAAGFARRRVA